MNDAIVSTVIGVVGSGLIAMLYLQFGKSGNYFPT